MSVVIKGVDVPTDCGKCFISDRTLCTNGCPLVQIPNIKRISNDIPQAVLLQNGEETILANVYAFHDGLCDIEDDMGFRYYDIPKSKLYPLP